MRKIVVLSFISMDGVMQAPGGPTEDTSGDFKFGGWTVPYFDDFAGKIMDEQMSRPFDLLLGRKTYNIFKSYWPQHADDIGRVFNKAIKFVASNSLSENTPETDWQKTVVLKGDVVAELKKLKHSHGPDLQVHGSGNFIQTLLLNDLVDELWLKIFPITLGKGKKLFAEGTIPAAFTLEKCVHSPTGVIFVNYTRAGEVKTGSF
jgi:dihydrofolate reductase